MPSVQLLVPLSPGCISDAAEPDTAMGHFLCPQPRGLLLSHSASPLPPCTQAAHATGLGSIWNPVYEQQNCRLLFFLPFPLLFPHSKAAAASRGLVLRQRWLLLLTAQEAEFQLCGSHPCPDPSDPLTAPVSSSWGSLLPCFHSYPQSCAAGRMDSSCGCLRTL